MFGLSFEKLVLVALVAGVLVGPQQLPVHAHRLATLVRSFRAFVDDQRVRAESELGVALHPAAWSEQQRAWDLRRYDPRHVVRTALTQPTDTVGAASLVTGADPRLVEEARRVRPGQTWLVTGSAAHPRRLLIASLPDDDPRRLAAEVAEVADGTQAEAGPGAAP